MPPLISEEENYVMDSGDESDDEYISTEMLEDIHDGIQYLPSVNTREARYKICDIIKQSQAERKGALLSIQNMGKCLHKGFKTVVKEILQYLPILSESGPEVSYFIL